MIRIRDGPGWPCFWLGLTLRALDWPAPRIGVVSLFLATGSAEFRNEAGVAPVMAGRREWGGCENRRTKAKHHARISRIFAERDHRLSCPCPSGQKWPYGEMDHHGSLLTSSSGFDSW